MGSINHLSDREIQSYIENKNIQRKTDIEEHLQHCAVCKRNLIFYRKLYSELEKNIEFQLSPKFSAQVISRIQQKREKKNQVIEWTFWVAGFILSLAVSVFFVNLKDLSGFLSTIYERNAIISNEIVAMFKPLFSWLNGSTDILIFATVILLIIALIDRLFVKPKLRPH